MDVQELIPSAEKVRFHSSGTEADMMAIRMARAYTGKDKIIKFEHHFHGWSDYLVAGDDGHDLRMGMAQNQRTVAWKVVYQTVCIVEVGGVGHHDTRRAAVSVTWARLSWNGFCLRASWVTPLGKMSLALS